MGENVCQTFDTLTTAFHPLLSDNLLPPCESEMRVIAGDHPAILDGRKLPPSVGLGLHPPNLIPKIDA